MKSDDSEIKRPLGKVETVVIDDTELGDVKIHEGVIASLARRAALSIDGVARLAGSSLVDNLAEMVGSRRMQSRSVTIVHGEKNDVSIELKIIFKFGFNIPEVAANVQKAVISAVEKTTGMNVTAVDVLIQEIEDEPEADVAEQGDLPLN